MNVRFNKDGSIVVPEFKIDTVKRTKQCPKTFWQIWKPEDIWFVYIIANENIISKVENEFISNCMSDGKSRKDAENEYSNAFPDILDTYSDVRIVVAKSKNKAKEIAFKNFKEFSNRTGSIKDYKFKVVTAEHVLGMSGEELINQFVFNTETRESEIPIGVKKHWRV